MTDDTHAVSPAIRAVKDITFGSVRIHVLKKPAIVTRTQIAGMASKVFEHPFDLTKVRLQSQVLDATARFNGPIDCLVRTFKNEGVRGLYRGLPAPIVGAMVENASLFVSYSQLQHVIRRVTGRPPSQDLTLPQLAIAGAGAGTVTSFVLTPVELVKCKMQVQMLAVDVSGTSAPSPSSGAAAATLVPTSIKPQTLPGPIAVLTSVIRNDGFRGLWLGQTGTLIRETGGGAAWFTCKEFVGARLIQRRAALTGTPLSRKDILPWESAVSGACAGAVFNFSLFPADTVKSAMQTEEELRPRGKGVPPPTFLGTAKAMYKAQGIRGFYAGCGITVARSIPSSAIIFLIYDGLSKRINFDRPTSHRAFRPNIQSSPCTYLLIAHIAPEATERIPEIVGINLARKIRRELRVNMSFSLIRQLARRTGTRLSASVGPYYVSLLFSQLNTGRRLPVSRTYASKAKVKSTASFVPGSQQLFESEEARAEYAKAESKMASVVDWFRKEVAAFETRASGRVTPALLSPVRVEGRGRQAVKLEEVATVGIKDGSVLIVTVFDEHNMKAVEQGIYTAKLPNIVPQRLDSRTLKIPIPKPTVEGRNMLVSTASRMAEDVRVQIRKHHQASVKKGKYEKHSVELEEFQKLSDKHVAEIDKILAQMKKATGSK
ncbi:mitochondrial carrier domain-containing protein [Lanmaoa asiatica]|nr:mitochondrial carrier domain-containing protein [Lanmaoa asiatica]